MNALELTARLVDQYVLPTYSDLELLVCEFEYMQGKRKADLVALSGGNLIAFEVKSERDTLQRLEGQLKGYLDSFEQVYVVTSKAHLQEIKRIADRRVGLIVEADGDIFLHRKAPIRKRLNPRAVVSILTKTALSRFVGIKPNLTADYTYGEMVDIAIKTFTQKTISAYIKDYAASKYQRCFPAFMNERGMYTHTDDLLFLSRIEPKVVAPLSKHHS